MIFFPINCNISTTGHKLQGKTLTNLVVNSWAYRMTHWVYVVLSRVTSLDALVLNEKLDESRSYKPNSRVMKWERTTKENVEKKHSEIEERKIISNT